MRIRPFLYFSFCVLLFSCERRPVDSEMREAWIPVYSQDVMNVKAITTGPVRTTVNAGKIYTVGSLIYQVEQDSGIHVINYSNPSSPQKIGFIRSFLCKEVAVKGGYIYTNNGSDLVVIDARDISFVREIARTPNVFPDLALQYPTKSSTEQQMWFECPDPKKGIVVKWEKKTVENPKCWR